MNSPDMATKEVKNGRLAMTAFVGFAVQVGAGGREPALHDRRARTEQGGSALRTPLPRCALGGAAAMPGAWATVMQALTTFACPAAWSRPPQALLTRQGPIEALQSHLSSPFENNFVGECWGAWAV